MDSRSIIHVRQPTETSCGQACAAMLLNKPIDLVIKELPHTKIIGTRHRDLIAYLQINGLICSPFFVNASNHLLPDLALVRVTWTGVKPVRAHLIVKCGDTWHDPLFEAPFRQWKPIIDRQYGRGRITSFVKVFV
jgi:hypothetical protein